MNGRNDPITTQAFLIPHRHHHQIRKGNSDSALLKNNYSIIASNNFPHTIVPPKSQKSDMSFARQVCPSDNEIKRCSTVSTIARPVSQGAFRSINVNGKVFNKFKSIYITVGSCLLEIVIVTLAKMIIFIIVSLTQQRLPILTLHVDLVHLSLTPILYSFGFAPLKKRLSRAFRVGLGVHNNINNNSSHDNNASIQILRHLSRSLSKRGYFSQ